MNLYVILALVLVLILVALIIVKVMYKSPNTSELYSDSNGSIILSDSNGNLSLTPNILNDLQTQVQAQKADITGLTTQINNIINGSTHIQSLNVDGTLTVNGVLTVNSGSNRPITLNKITGSDKTTLISYQLNGTEYNFNGLDGNGLLWGSGVVPKGWEYPTIL